MLTSALVLITILPLQVSPRNKPQLSLSKPLAVAILVDSAKILGLPKLKLRDSNGNRYQPDKVLLQEPLATVQEGAGIVFVSDVGKRNAYIQSYIHR